MVCQSSPTERGWWNSPLRSRACHPGQTRNPRQNSLSNIRVLPLQKGGEDNAAADARELFQCYALASLARAWQKKAGTAGPISVARDLKRIASKSSTLLELLKRADRNTFEAWAGAQYPEAVTLERGAHEWLQLKNLLDITVHKGPNRREA